GRPGPGGAGQDRLVPHARAARARHRDAVASRTPGRDHRPRGAGRRIDVHGRPAMNRALLLALALPLAACAADKAAPKVDEAVPVRVARVSQKDVPVAIAAIGTVQAHATVGIRAQVGGVLEKVHFREGDDVRAGDLLFTIDARGYAAALAEA